MFSTYDLVLITIAVIAIIILTLWYIWNVIFLRKWRRLFFAVLGGFMATRSDKYDRDKIKPSEEPERSDAMKAQAAALNFDDALEKSRPPLPEQAEIPATETGEFARVTSDNGWPRELSKDEKRDTRPFRAVHLNTENEEYQDAIKAQTRKSLTQTDTQSESE